MSDDQDAAFARAGHAAHQAPRPNRNDVHRLRRHHPVRAVPSRAAFITGEYGHNNGVLANVPGYPDLLEKENVLPAWLRRAGVPNG